MIKYLSPAELKKNTSRIKINQAPGTARFFLWQSSRCVARAVPTMLSRVFPTLNASFIRRFATAQKIHYTYCDEAPMLATIALLPIIKRFTQPAGIEVQSIDISVAARIIASFPENLTPAQRMPDNLGTCEAPRHCRLTCVVFC
jgi:hypothetical protein